MRFALILSALAMFGLAGVWLFAGRQVVLLIDRFATTEPEALPIGPMVYSPGGLAIGDYPNWTLLPDSQPADFRAEADDGGRLVLHSQGKDFPLGTRIGPPAINGLPDIPFTVDPGDDIRFIRMQSLISWPTFFAMNFMTGQAPSWRRNLYFRLTWRKPSGARLDMAWRYEQWFYPASGWSPAWMAPDGTGLIRLEISGDPGPESVAAYLARTKGWASGDYRLEPGGVSADGGFDVVRVINNRDAAGAQPGGGLSVELHLDRTTHRIEQETGFQ